MDLVSMNSLASRGNREQSYQLCKVAACGLWLGTKKKKFWDLCPHFCRKKQASLPKHWPVLCSSPTLCSKQSY